MEWHEKCFSLTINWEILHLWNITGKVHYSISKKCYSILYDWLTASKPLFLSQQCHSNNDPWMTILLIIPCCIANTRGRLTTRKSMGNQIDKMSPITLLSTCHLITIQQSQYQALLKKERKVSSWQLQCRIIYYDYGSMLLCS